jgi:NAD(P)-dependent dehydrogenase (short-subunit alcohol dehydrogenase family)
VLLVEQRRHRALEDLDPPSDPEGRRPRSQHLDAGLDLRLVVHAAGVEDPLVNETRSRRWARRRPAAGRTAFNTLLAVTSSREPVLDPLARFRLDGKVAIVTGASSGLGARFARVLDAAGAHVVITARRSDRLDEVAADLADPLGVAADLTEPGAVDRVVAATVEHFGHVDVVVNNAGASDEIPALDFPVDRFREIVEVNLVAPFALAQAAARRMISSGRGGSIVNIASQYGVVGVNAGIVAYAASKGGLVNLTRQLAVEWARAGVRVNTIGPGYFRTEMTTGVFDDTKTEAWLRRTAPMGRGGDVPELDGALLYLASDASSYTTGAILAVDGGWTAT